MMKDLEISPWLLLGLQILDITCWAENQLKKYRIRETKNVLTDADSRTDTILERLHDLSKKIKKKNKKIIGCVILFFIFYIFFSPPCRRRRRQSAFRQKKKKKLK